MSNFTDAFVQSIQTMVQNYANSFNDPADAIRGLAALASFPSTSSLAVSQETAAICRRAVLASLATATSSYTLSSVNEATAIITLIRPLYDSEILYAADNNDNLSYQALRTLRASVINDLNTRAINLPNINLYDRPAAIPAVTVAYQLYKDATRENQVIQLNNPVHPLFMPLSIYALSK